MKIRRIIGALAALALAGGVIAATGEAAYADTTPVPNGIYELYIPFFNQNAAKCLDVPRSNPNPGVQVQVFHCHGSDSSGANQLWKATPLAGDSWQLTNQATGRCLSASLSQDTHVIQDVCVGTAAQAWKFDPNPSFGSTSGVINMLAGNCLATANLSGADDTLLVLASCQYNNLRDPARRWARQNWTLA